MSGHLTVSAHRQALRACLLTFPVGWVNRILQSGDARSSSDKVAAEVNSAVPAGLVGMTGPLGG